MIHLLRNQINNFYHVKYLHHFSLEIFTVKSLYSVLLSVFKNSMATNRYCIDLAKRGTAGCKNCNQKIDKGVVRLAKIIPNPFTDSGGEMKQWFHVRCMFEKLSRARATTKKIESPDDIEGWDDMAEEHKTEVLQCLSDFSFSTAPKKTPQKKKAKMDVKAEPEQSSEEPPKQDKSSSPSKDDTFREFRKLCNKVADENRYSGKTTIIKEFLTKGTDGNGFKGDLYLWVKMLLPGVEKQVYNLQSKQLIKLFSEIFHASQEEMLEDLEQGDVAKTIGTFFEDSSAFPPASKSTLTLQEVDGYLVELSKHSKEAEQIHILKKVAKRCTANDLQIFIRLVKHDLKINAGPKPVLDAINPNAYEAFQASRDLKQIVMDVLKSKGGKGNILTVQSTLMTPVLPMLAQACGSVDMAFKKCPKGFFVEIKYDGERVQVHKKGSDFSYFSRSLKPVMPHKIMHFKDYIPKAFPHGNNLIIDSEILLVSKDGIPLPFGTLGAHRKTAFKDATVCLYVFDILQFNDENLMKKPLCERREILKENMTEIKNHVMFSEMKEINDKKELRGIISSVIKQGLEGLVIKDKMSVYEPGKRHWLKVKKDYLKDDDWGGDSMADSADLVVLGAYYGTGKKGGMKSVFLMGCLDEYSGKWCTVTKVGGFTDDELKELQEQPEMTKISKNPDLVPSWLKIKKQLIPDFIIKDIEKSPVWEIIGTEFSKADIHTANGLSIRFPRVKCVRDKTWQQSTTLQQLQNLYEVSKQTSERVGLEIMPDDENDVNDTTIAYESPEEKPMSSKMKTSKRPSDKSLSPTPKKKRIESPAENSPSISTTDSVNKVKDEVLSDEDSDDKNESSEKKTKSSKVKTLKRPSDENWSSPPKKQRTKSSVESSPGNSTTDSVKNPLPDVFTGVKLYIPTSLKDADVLCRYFTAFDGTLLKESQMDEANVIIEVDEDIKAPKNAKKVTVDWLWACIKLKKKLPTDPYKPK